MDLRKEVYSKGSEEIIYYRDEVGAIWVTQSEMAKLFGVTRTAVTKRLKEAVSREAVCSEMEPTEISFPVEAPDGKQYQTKLYGQAILERLGQLFRSKKAQEFLQDTKQNRQKIVRFNRDNLSIEVIVSPDEDTVWLTQCQIAELFQTSQQDVSHHVRAILESGELGAETIHKEYLYMPLAGREYETAYYNLEMILSIGYRVNSRRGIEFRRWASKVLRQYLLKGYAVDQERTAVSASNFLSLSRLVQDMAVEMNDFDRRIKTIEDRIRLENDTKVFFQGEVFDGLSFAEELVRRARRSIVLVDPYCDIWTLSLLKERGPKVSLIVYCSPRTPLTEHEISAFRRQYGQLEVKRITNNHDRFLFLDEEEGYQFGSSFNYLGKRTTRISKMDPREIQPLLESFQEKIP